jgi:hypothetical protein
MAPRARWSCVAVALAVLAAPAARAADPCSRLRGVKSWELSFTADVDHAGLGPGKPGLIRFRASGAGTLVPRGEPGWVWAGTGTYSVSSATTVSRQYPDDMEWVSYAVGGGTAPPLAEVESTEPWWLVLDGDCRYQLFITNLRAPLRASGHNRDGYREEIREDWDFSLRVWEQPAPARGLVIQKRMPAAVDARESVSADVQSYADMSFSPRGNIPGSSERGIGELSFTLLPEPEELELMVEAPGYERWTPSANHDVERPGNPLPLRARLQQRGGGRPGEKASQLRFALVQVSNEPGVALNHPPSERAGVEPDLRFEPARNPDLTVSEDGLRAETPVSDGAFHEAEAELSSFDWGGWGELRVTAVMGDGREILGRLAGDPRPQILLPKRKPESRIPDALRASAGLGELPDDDDGEGEPAGDGFAGDGLTLYEEYRGFYVNGAHVRGSPTRKDLFVRDEIGGRAKLGLARFAQVTGLRVHHELLAEELGAHRVINVNRMIAPHRVDQHGLVLAVGTTAKPGEDAAGGPDGRAVGGPSTPERVTRVLVHPRVGGDAPGLPRLVAHELSHGVNVAHHGERDVGFVTWTPGTRFGGAVVIENGEAFGLHAEDGTRLRLDRPALYLWVAAPHGQHSGSESCWMRYRHAGAYRDDSDPAVRYWTGGAGEVAGAQLCQDGTGTGINASDRAPRPRHHAACADGCAQQLRVNDAGEAPRHGCAW